MVIMLDSIGRRELAEDVGREALTHLPNEAGLHFNLANTLGKLKQFSQAERHFLKATQLDTQNAKYHANLGALNIFLILIQMLLINLCCAYFRRFVSPMEEICSCGEKLFNCAQLGPKSADGQRQPADAAEECGQAKAAGLDLTHFGN